MDQEFRFAPPMAKVLDPSRVRVRIKRSAFATGFGSRLPKQLDHISFPGGFTCRMDATQTLYHVSDEPGITLFEPRESRLDQQESLVWAIDHKHLPNYLLPRDCPRVTFAAGPDTSKHDIERLMGSTNASRVIAVESAWISRISEAKLYVYELSSPHFASQDVCAGYYVSPIAVRPNAEHCVDNLLEELFRHDIELRVMKSLWDLRDAVIKSSLEYSIIRMRNAQPPEKGYPAYLPLG